MKRFAVFGVLVLNAIPIHAEFGIHIKDTGDGAIHELSFSQDGKLLAVRGGVEQPTLSIWDFEAKKRVSRFANRYGHVFPQFSEDGLFIYSVGRKFSKSDPVGWEIYRHNAKTDGRKLVAESDAPDLCHALWIDKRMIVTSGIDLDDADKKPLLTFLDYGTKKTHVVHVARKFKVMTFSRDRNLVAIRFEKGHINVINWETKNIIYDVQLQLQANQQCDACLFVYNDKRLFLVITGAGAPTIVIADIASKKLTRVNESYAGFPSPRYPPLLSPDGRFVVTQAPSGFGVFDVERLAYTSMVRPKSRIELSGALVFTSNGKALVAGDTSGAIWTIGFPFPK